MGRFRLFGSQLVEHQGNLPVRPLHLLAAGGQGEICFVVRRTVSFADPAAGRDVVGTAGHGVAGEIIVSFREIRPLPGLADQAYPLPVVAFRMVHAVHIEDAELLVGHPDGIRLHVIGKVFVRDAVVHGAVQVLKEDGGVRVHGAQLPAPGALVETRGAAVDADHVRDLHGIGQDLAHVGHVVVKGAAVGGGDHLRPVPQAGKPERVQLFDSPHGVVFHDDAGGLMFVLQLLQAGGGQFLFLLEHDQDALVLLQGFGVPFGFAVLAADDQALAAVGEALVAQDRQAEGGFTAFQESGDQVDRYKSANHR